MGSRCDIFLAAFALHGSGLIQGLVQVDVVQDDPLTENGTVDPLERARTAGPEPL